MLKLKTDRQVTLIVNNVVAACTNINKLSNAGYQFVMLSSGFIAHYNRGGFMCAYSNPGLLKQAILNNQQNNQWNNFRPGEQDYDYYKQKQLIYNKICDALTK